MSENIPEGQKEQFYKQVCAALIRRLGGSCIIAFNEFELPAEAIANRRALDDSGIELVVIEPGEKDPEEVKFQ